MIVRSQSGAILPLFALLIFVIILAIAFVIDGARLSSANREKSQTADLVALACLQGYFSELARTATPFTATVQKRAFAECLEAAVRTGQLNFLTSRRATSVDVEQLRTILGDLAPGYNAGTPEAGNYNDRSGRLGFVVLGYWFSERPEEVDCSIALYRNSCACDSDLSTSVLDPEDPTRPTGCFVECDGNSGCPALTEGTVRIPANAARVTLHTEQPTGGIRNFFGSVAEIQETHIQRSGTAALTPRHTVILVDLSRSTTAETHYQWQRNPPATEVRAEYAFRCAGSCSQESVDADGDRGVCGSGDQVLDDLHEGWDSSDPPFVPRPPAGYRQVYRDLPGFTDPTLYRSAEDEHAVRDYQCVHIDFHGDGNADADYIVDFGFKDAGVLDFKLPQPHTNILAATRGVLTRMLANRYPGDRTGMIGFDRRIFSDSTHPETYRYIKPLQVNPPSGSAFARPFTFGTLLALTDPTATPVVRQRRAEHGFFPGGDEFSDLPLAVFHAQKMLRETVGYENAQNSVVLITGGLTSCFRDPVEREEIGNDPPPTPRCDLTFNSHWSSLTELLEARVRGALPGHLEKERIALHAIHIGSQVGPHRIAVRKHGTSRCLTEDELRSAGLYTSLPLAGGTHIAYERIGSGNTTTSYFDAAIVLNAAARQVGGLWVTARADTRCVGILSPPCPDWSAKVDEACAAVTDRPDRAVPPPYSDPTDQADVLAKTRALMLTAGELTARGVPPVAVDGAGRIFCDERCRERNPSGIYAGVEDQVRDALAALFTTPPIKLVHDSDVRD